MYLQQRHKRSHFLKYYKSLRRHSNFKILFRNCSYVHIELMNKISSTKLSEGSMQFTVNMRAQTGWDSTQLSKTLESNYFVNVIFRDIAPCSPFVIRRFGGRYHLNLQGPKPRFTDYTTLYPRRWQH
jgi:hypothetical protein